VSNTKNAIKKERAGASARRYFDQVEFEIEDISRVKVFVNLHNKLSYEKSLLGMHLNMENDCKFLEVYRNQLLKTLIFPSNIQPIYLMHECEFPIYLMYLRKIGQRPRLNIPKRMLPPS